VGVDGSFLSGFLDRGLDKLKGVGDRYIEADSPPPRVTLINLDTHLPPEKFRRASGACPSLAPSATAEGISVSLSIGFVCQWVRKPAERGGDLRLRLLLQDTTHPNWAWELRRKEHEK
jgi:hypothetical protein